MERMFDDFAVGDRFESRGWTVSEAAVLDFSALYDPQPFHLDKEAAAYGPYGGLIASGFQTLAVGFRMFYQTGAIRDCSMGSPGMDELRWLAPVRPGDTLHTVARVEELRPSGSKPDRGVSRWKFEICNQKREVVCSFVATILLRRRRS